jgi:hypothetical protein
MKLPFAIFLNFFQVYLKKPKIVHFEDRTVEIGNILDEPMLDWQLLEYSLVFLVR